MVLIVCSMSLFPPQLSTPQPWYTWGSSEVTVPYRTCLLRLQKRLCGDLISCCCFFPSPCTRSYLRQTKLNQTDGNPLLHTLPVVETLPNIEDQGRGRVNPLHHPLRRCRRSEHLPLLKLIGIILDTRTVGHSLADVLTALGTATLKGNGNEATTVRAPVWTPKHRQPLPPLCVRPPMRNN